MSRWNLLIILVIGPVIWSGCSMCCGPYDYEYPILENARYPRLDPEFGRVGSILSDPNAPVGAVPKTNADVPVEAPDPLDDDDGPGPDDPDFNDLDPDGDGNSGELPDPDMPSVPDPFDDIDTSASRLPNFRYLRR